jgi:hypothetical protein
MHERTRLLAGFICPSGVTQSKWVESSLFAYSLHSITGQPCPRRRFLEMDTEKFRSPGNCGACAIIIMQNCVASYLDLDTEERRVLRETNSMTAKGHRNCVAHQLPRDLVSTIFRCFRGLTRQSRLRAPKEVDVSKTNYRKPHILISIRESRYIFLSSHDRTLLKSALQAEFNVRISIVNKSILKLSFPSV